MASLRNGTKRSCHAFEELDKYITDFWGTCGPKITGIEGDPISDELSKELRVNYQPDFTTDLWKPRSEAELINYRGVLAYRSDQTVFDQYISDDKLLKEVNHPRTDNVRDQLRHSYFRSYHVFQMMSAWINSVSHRAEPIFDDLGCVLRRPQVACLTLTLNSKKQGSICRSIHVPRMSRSICFNKST